MHSSKPALRYRQYYLIFFLLSSIHIAFAQTSKFTASAINITDAEVVNSGRGFYRWNGEEKAPYVSIDRYQRYRWSDIEISKGVYDFSALEAEAEKAKNDIDGRGLFGFAVRCLVNGTSKSYPAYLDSYMKAWYSNSKLCWVPDWNDPDFLERVDSLLANLGRKFNNDPRIGFVEVRTYGNWGEWHMSGFETPPYPAVAVTNTSIHRMIDAHVKAFPDKQIIMMSDNSEGLSYAMDKIGLTYPIGWRRDSWCNKTFLSLNSKSAWSKASNRWQTAPVIIECYGEGSNYSMGLSQVTTYHISEIGNGNFDTWATLTTAKKDSIVLCAKTSGYRLLLRSLTFPNTIVAGNKASFSAEWSNIGVAPVYRDWRVTYRICNTGSGAVVWEGNSKLNLRTILPTYNQTTKIDVPIKVDDSFDIPANLLKGNYTLEVIIPDTANYLNPLRLAIQGRKSNGAYTIGTVTIDSNANIEEPDSTKNDVTIHSFSKHTINLDIKKSANYGIKIYTSNGKCLYAADKTTLNVGLHTINYNELSNAVYFIKIKSDFKEFILSFIMK